MDREELTALGLDEEAVEKIVGEQERLREEYEIRIASVEREHEIEKILVQSGARNIKAVRALVGDGDAESVKREIDKLKNDEETRFLFEKKGSFMPARSPERLPDTQKAGYEERLKEARCAGNTLEAIRIKQQAANEGIVLI